MKKNKNIYILIISLLIVLILSILLSYYDKSKEAEADFKYTGYGANQFESGSMHILEIADESLILDAGGFYDNHLDRKIKVDDKLLNSAVGIIISHAHSDHSARLIELVTGGYDKPIYMTKPTKALLNEQIISDARDLDMGIEHLFFSQSQYIRNKKTSDITTLHFHQDCTDAHKIKNYDRTDIYVSRTQIDVEHFKICVKCLKLQVKKVMELIVEIPLYEEIKISDKFAIEFFNTPHIPGSVMTVITNTQTGKRLLYTGDVGQKINSFLNPQDVIKDIDYAIIEGTNGVLANTITDKDRLNFQVFLGTAVAQNKRIVIPTYALDRTQQILKEINIAIDSGIIPKETKVRVMSLSAIKYNSLYKNVFTTEDYKAFFTEDFNLSGPFKPFYGEYRILNYVDHGEIVIASSANANSSYSKEYVKNWIDDPNTVFVFTAGQEINSVGYKLLTGKFRKRIEIDGEIYDKRAEIVKFNCFSGHGDYSQISQILKQSDQLKKVLIVHSSKLESLQLIGKYRRDFYGTEFIAPEIGKSIYLY